MSFWRLLTKCCRVCCTVFLAVQVVCLPLTSVLPGLTNLSEVHSGLQPRPGSALRWTLILETQVLRLQVQDHGSWSIVHTLHQHGVNTEREECIKKSPYILSHSFHLSIKWLHENEREWKSSVICPYVISKTWQSESLVVPNPVKNDISHNTSAQTQSSLMSRSSWGSCFTFVTFAGPEAS